MYQTMVPTCTVGTLLNYDDLKASNSPINVLRALWFVAYKHKFACVYKHLALGDYKPDIAHVA